MFDDDDNCDIILWWEVMRNGEMILRERGSIDSVYSKIEQR